ncbi:hypothetical protein LTR08_009006 [Meristemomyces frigidus]|nr:hypothetical protein LTR08_009006 [Meristemomyces frigidus]
MAGLKVGAAVFGIVVGTIETIETSIECYDVIKDKSGVPKALRDVSEKLPSIRDLLMSAEAQYMDGKLEQSTWDDAKEYVEHCKQLCKEMRELLISTSLKDETGRAVPLWKVTTMVLAEQLSKELWLYLELLAKRQIVTNTALLEDIRAFVHEDNFVQQASSTMLERCLQSLAFPNHRRRENLKAKTKGTCGWVYDHDQYKGWMKSGGTLLLRGRPGTGKSTLMESMLDEDLAKQNTNPSTAVASFFHRRGDVLQYSVLGLFRSILHQLLSHDNDLRVEFAVETHFEERCKKEGEVGRDKKWDWTEKELRGLLKEYAKKFTQRYTLRLYIDALDESGEAYAYGLWDYLKSLLGQNTGQLSICISCRPYPDVEFDPNYRIIVTDETQEDIVTHIRAVFQANKKWQSRTDLKEIESALEERASGVFQWIVLVTRRVRGLHSESKEFILADAGKLPRGLGDLYEVMLRTMVQESKEDGIQALRIFRWVTFATRPLSLTELRYAVATDLDSTFVFDEQYRQSKHWCDDDIIMADRVERLSQGLAKVVLSANNLETVQFDHQFVKEYMCKDGIRFLEDTWHGDDLDVRNSFGRTPLSLAAEHGHDRVVKALQVTGEANVDAKDRDDRTPLSFAAAGGHEGVVKMLLASGKVIVDAKDDNNRTPLWFAAAGGHEGVVKMLLASGKINVDAIDLEGQTPLFPAARHGHTTVVDVLLATGRVDADRMSDFGQTPLMLAAAGGHEGVVKALLATGKVGVNDIDKWDRTPLLYAVESAYKYFEIGDEGVVIDRPLHSEVAQAFKSARQAVDSTPDGHPDQRGYLDNLGTNVQSRYEWMAFSLFGEATLGGAYEQSRL